MTVSTISSTNISIPKIDEVLTSGWQLVCNITYNRDTWVKLLQPPSEFAAEEALLMCQESLNRWIAWVPEHGEVILDRGDFYC